jgi:hypothetical protein
MSSRPLAFFQQFSVRIGQSEKHCHGGHMIQRCRYSINRITAFWHISGGQSSDLGQSLVQLIMP